MAMIVPTETTQKLAPLKTPQYTTSVTPEMIAGPQVRMLEKLGKTGDEITAWVVKDRNNKDLALINDIENKGKEIEMRRKLAASKMQGKDAEGLLGREETVMDGNYKQLDGEPPMIEVQEYNQMYEALDERLKGAADNLRSRRKTSYLQAIGAHEQRQMLAHTVASSNDSIQLSIANASIDHTNETLRNEEIAKIDSQVNALANAQGWSADQRDFKRKTAVSTIHTNTVKGYLAAKDIAGAEAYFTNYKDEIVGDTSTMAESIATRKVDIKAEQSADEAMVLYAAGNKTEAYALIDKLPPDEQAAARTQLQASIKESEDIEDGQLQTAQQTLNDQIIGQNRVEKFSDLDQDALAVLAKHKDGLKLTQALRKAFIDRDKKEEPPTDVQMENYQELSKISSGTPEEKRFFKTVDIEMVYGAVLGPTNLKHFMDKQTTMRNKTDDSILSKADHENARVGFLGLNEPGWELIKFKMLTNKNKRVAELEKIKGGPLSMEEYKDAVKESMPITGTDSHEYYRNLGGGKFFDPYGTAAAAKRKLLSQLPKGEWNFNQQLNSYFDETLKTSFEKGGLYVGTTKDTRKERVALLKGKLVQKLDELNAARLSEGLPELGPSERMNLIRRRMETNKVYVEDWGSDSLVPIFTLSLSERAELNPYVKVGGVERPISEIDKFLENKAQKAAVYKYMDSKTDSNGRLYLKERSYQNIAQARWEMGNIDTAGKTVKRMREGSIKHVDGKMVSRGGVIDILRQTPLDRLKAKDFRRDLKTLYAADGLEILDWVIKQKQKEANQ